MEEDTKRLRENVQNIERLKEMYFEFRTSKDWRSYFYNRNQLFDEIERQNLLGYKIEEIREVRRKLDDDYQRKTLLVDCFLSKFEEGIRWREEDRERVEEALKLGRSS